MKRTLFQCAKSVRATSSSSRSFSTSLTRSNKTINVDKEQQPFSKVSSASVKSPYKGEKSAESIRKDKDSESSFFDNPNPIPNLNTSEKMQNINPIGSYQPGSYVGGSTSASTTDTSNPNMGKNIDKDPTGFYGFDNEIQGGDLYSTKERVAKSKGIDSLNNNKSIDKSEDLLGNDEWKDTKDLANKQWEQTKKNMSADINTSGNSSSNSNIFYTKDLENRQDDTLFNKAKQMKDQVKDAAYDAKENVKDAAYNAKETIKEKASNLFSQDTKDAAYDAKENVKDAAYNAKEDIKDAAYDNYDKKNISDPSFVKDRASNIFDQGKNKAYETKGYTEAYLEQGMDKVKDAGEAVKDTVKNVKDKVVSKVSEWKDNIAGPSK